MPTVVDIPDAGVSASFPDTMTEDDIKAVVRRKFGKGRGQGTPIAPEPAAPAPAPEPVYVPDLPEIRKSFAEMPPGVTGTFEGDPKFFEQPEQMPERVMRQLGETKVAKFISKPFVDLGTAAREEMAKATAQDPNRKRAAITTGIAGGAGDLAGFFTSPLGIATLGIGALPKAAQSAISTAFVAQMALQLPDTAIELMAELKKPEDQRDYEKIARLSTGGAAGILFTAVGAKHGMSAESINEALTKPKPINAAAVSIEKPPVLKETAAKIQPVAPLTAAALAEKPADVGKSVEAEFNKPIEQKGAPDAIQEQKSDASLLREEGPGVGLPQVGARDKEPEVTAGTSPPPSQPEAPAKPDVVSAASRVGDAAKRRINTIADRGGNLTKEDKVGLAGVVGSDPQAAYDFALEQSKKDWEDEDFKRGYERIAKHIEENWPLKTSDADRQAVSVSEGTAQGLPTTEGDALAPTVTSTTPPVPPSELPAATGEPTLTEEGRQHSTDLPEAKVPDEIIPPSKPSPPKPRRGKLITEETADIAAGNERLNAINAEVSNLVKEHKAQWDAGNETPLQKWEKYPQIRALEAERVALESKVSELVKAQKEKRKTATEETGKPAIVSKTALPAKVEEQPPPPAPENKETPAEQRSGFDTKEAKSQKKFLLSEIDKAIEEAPETTRGAWLNDELKADHAVAAEALQKRPSESAYGKTAEESKAAVDQWNQENADKFEPLFQKYNIPKDFPGSTEFKSLAGTMEQQYKPEVHSLADRISMLKDAIETANNKLAPRITIEVPGDGVFEIINNKEALKEFREKAESFPTTAPRAPKPSTARATSTSAPALGKPDVASIKKAADLFTSDDATRKILANIYSDGKQTVATNGRALIIIKKALGGTEKKPFIETSEGKKWTDEQKFPNYKQVIPDEGGMKVAGKDLDTGRLFNVLRQAQEAVSERSNSIKIWLNPDGSIGISAISPDTVAYSHNVHEKAKLAVALDPKYLISAINAARMVGDEKVTLLYRDELSPVVVNSKLTKSVIMPMRLEGTGVAKFSKATKEEVTPKPESWAVRTAAAGDKSVGEVYQEQYSRQLDKIITAPGTTGLSSAQEAIRTAEMLSMPKEQLAKDLAERGMTKENIAYALKNYKGPESSEPKIVGMGGAIPSEFTPPEGSATGIKNAETDRQRQRRGLEPTMAPLRQSNEAVFDRVMARIDQDPGWQDRLVTELQTHPRQVDADETVALQHRYIDLQNHYDQSTRDLSQAYDDGRVDQVAELQARTAEWSDRLRDFEDMTRRIGTEWGRAGQIRQRLLNRDFSLAAMESQWRAARGGRPLTPDERLELIETQKKLVEAEARATAAEQKAQQEASDKAATNALNEILKKQAAEKPSYDKRIIAHAEKIVVGMERAAESARDRIKDRLSTMGLLSGPIDPTLLDDFAIVGSAKIARKALDFAKFTDEFVRDFGEKIKPWLDQIWDASNARLEAGLEKAPADVKRVIRKLDPTERIADVKDKIKNIVAKGELDALNPQIQRLIRSLVELNPKITRDQLVDTVHDILKTEMPAITRREAQDAISGYGQFTPLRKDAVSLTVRDLKGQLQQVAKLQDIQSRQPPKKTGLERREPTDEERRLIKQVNEAKRRYGIVVTDPATQLKSALAARKTALKNQIADLEYEIAQKQRIVKSKSPSPTDPELDTLRKRRDDLKAEHDRIFPKQPLTDAQRAALVEKSLDREIAEVERQIKEGDIFPPGKPKDQVSNPAIVARQERLKALQNERQGLRDAIQPRQYKTPEEKYLSALKTRLQREIADKTDRIARGDFTEKPRRTPPPLSKEMSTIKAQAESIRQQWQRKLLEERLRQRPRMQKFLDSMVKWRQAFVISGIKSIFKLASAAVEGIVILPSREVAGTVLSKLPVIRDVAAKAPSEGGLNVAAEANALSETWSNLLSDFGKNIKGDKPDFEKLYGGRETMPPELQNYVGFLHGALKSPLARNTFTRSFTKRLDFAIDHGVDVSDPLIQMELGRQAWEDSSFWRFQNRNLVSSIFRQAIRRVEDKGYRKTAAVLRFTFPVVTVPTNIVARVFESVAGIPLGAGKLIKAAYQEGGLKQAIANLSPEQADLIMRNLKTGSIGVAFMLIGAFNPGSFGGYYRQDKKYKPGDVKFGRARLPLGFKYPMPHIPIHGQPLVTMERDIPSFLLHNPFLEAAQFGATMRQVADAKMRKTDKETTGLWLGAWSASMKALEEQPFLREGEDIVKAADPRQARRFLGEQLRSYLIPQAVQNLAEWMDKHDAQGEPIQRKPRTVMENVKMGLPGLRGTVPAAKK